MPDSKVYEYKLISGTDAGGNWSDLESEINELSKQGWEVVSTAGISKGTMTVAVGTGRGRIGGELVITMWRLKSD